MKYSISRELTGYLKKHGFQKYDNNYYRIVNDVIQGFTVRKRQYDHGRVIVINIKFNFGTLYGNWEGNIFLEPFSLYDFDMIRPKEVDGRRLQRGDIFRYEKGNEASMHDCFNLMISELEQYVFPYFDAHNSCEAFFKDKNLMLYWTRLLYSLYMQTGQIEQAASTLKREIDQQENILRMDEYRLSITDQSDPLYCSYEKQVERLRAMIVVQKQKFNYISCLTKEELVQIVQEKVQRNRKYLESLPKQKHNSKS